MAVVIKEILFRQRATEVMRALKEESSALGGQDFSSEPITASSRSSRQPTRPSPSTSTYSV